MLELIFLFLLSFGQNQVFALELKGFDPTCQNHLTNGYGYRLFFNLPTSSLLKDGSVQFNFSLSAPSDGHVLLAEKPNTYPGYEVVIGAGMNEFSEIRKYVSSKLEVKTSRMTKNIVSADQIRNFSITINQSEIAVATSYNNQSWAKFLSWKDPAPLDVKYVSFCAWTGVTVNWYFDCKGASVVPQTMSTTKKLRRKLLKNYDPYSVPVQDDNKLMIDTTIKLHYINLDPKKSLMKTHGKFNFTWHDYRIKWNPAEFDNISSLNLLHREIWLPEFTLVNSLDMTSSPMGKSVTRITYNGLVSWTPDAEMVTWCYLDLKEWPFDKQFCNVSLGLYSHPESVHISLSKVMPELSLKNLEWTIISVTGETSTIINPWELNKTEDFTESHKAFMLNVTLKRQSQMHVWSFFVPIIATVFIIVGSFWLPVFCVKRLFLHSVCLILLLVNVLSLAEALPALPNSTPHIISVSSGLLFLASIHVIFASCLMSITKIFEAPPPRFMTSVVTNPVVQTIFCLFGDYQAMEEESFSIPDDNKIIPRQVNHAVMFGIMLDRILFSLTMVYVFIIFIL